MCDLLSYGSRTMDTMPQTVPSAGFTPPCDYSNFAADCFDLSLLPSPDGEVPYSPVSVQQVMSFYSDPTTSPPSMFPAGGPGDDFHHHGHSGLKPVATTTTAAPTTTTMAQVQVSTDPYAFPLPATVKEEPQHYHREPSCSYMQSPYSVPPVASVSPVPSSPAGSTSSSASHQRSGSPAIKPEQSIDLQDILQESRLLQESLAKQKQKRSLSCEQESKPQMMMSPPREAPPVFMKKEDVAVAGPSGACAGAGGQPDHDHRLLREVLRDTSFQRRYNIKPFDFVGLGFEGARGVPLPPPAGEAAGAAAVPPEVKLEEGEALQLSREKMEPVLSLAIEQLRKDVGDTCSVLGISPDPARWAAGDVRAWLLWTLRQYGLPMIPMEYFDMDGAALASLTEHDFQQRAPQCGSTLYAQLEIWKAACQDLDVPWTNSSTSSSSIGEASDDEDDDAEVASASPSAAGSVSGSASGSAPAAAPTPGKAPSSRATGGGGSGGGGGGGGSHIHLWQFLKELLAAPQLHGSCIRWLDRSKGVFKIEDSVRVARLWGKRKNRPAMNYDKLSRSIRQYYKKGIMKKTERSQRLVYQFCHPYSL